MIHQPVPRVSSSDVERIVRRDFPQEQFDVVMAILDEYGQEKWELGIPRVRLAVLKLANGSLTDLRRHMKVAKADYRDVLAPAEYPKYSKMESDIRMQRGEELKWIIDSDWKQYDTWLRRAN